MSSKVRYSEISRATSVMAQDQSRSEAEFLAEFACAKIALYLQAILFELVLLAANPLLFTKIMHLQ